MANVKISALTELTALGIDDTYRVHKVSHEAEGNCQDVLSTFKLYPIMTRST